MPKTGQTLVELSPGAPAAAGRTPPADLLTPSPAEAEASTPAQRSVIMRSQWRAREFLGIAIAAVALYTISGFLTALVWGGVFAIATWPLYQRTRERWPRLANGVTLPLLFTAALALIFLIPLIMVGLEAAKEAQGMLELMQSARSSGIPVPRWAHHLPLGAESVVAWWENNLSNPEDAHEFFSSLDSRSMAVTKAVGSQVAHRTTLFCFSLLTLFFLYKDGAAAARQCTFASRRLFGRRGEVIARQIVASIHGTVAGLVLVGVGEGLLMGVVYLLAGAPHPALFGVVTAIAAMIPFCAMIAIGLVSVLIFVKGATVAAISVFVIGAVVIFVADHFVRPTLIGGSTQLPFLWVLLGILGGAETWGMLGLFVGPAAMAALHLVWRSWTRERGGDKLA
ncbi:AI-2E family transporter [Acetobacter sp. DsW_063]|uniref:AI-2E family transporter n=1 Tax=Acetobacter sp. DsW_063 TaxID=1514894 RepID=UPI0018E9483F|nr:AI-2E family transporter [Acetobacter sp. DsW_063]